MRKIAFRVWDQKEGRMYLNPVVVNGRFYLNEFHREIDISDLDVGKQNLMQFTGLLDKNGKDIYEGDLLRTEGEMIGEVIWKSGLGEWEGSSVGFTLYWHYGGGRGVGAANKLCNNDKYEIVGNIYENKELLK